MKSALDRRRFPDDYDPKPRRSEPRGEMVAAKGYSVLAGDAPDRDGRAGKARLFELALRGIVVGLGFLVGSALIVMVAKIVLANLRALE